MLRQLIKDSLIYGIAGIISRGLPVIMVPFYTRVLSPEDYGVIDIIAIITALVNLTVALEISQGVARYYADEKAESEKTAFASSALWFASGAYGLFIFVCLFNSNALTTLLLGSQKWQAVLQMALVAMGTNGIFYFLQDLLRWQLKPKKYAIASLIYSSIATGTAAILIMVIQTGVIGIFYGQIVGAVIGSLFSLIFSRGIYSFLFDWNKCRKMLKFSVPLVPSSIAVFLSLYIDRISIKYFMTLSDVGLYGIGFRFASMISLLIIGIQGSLTPLIYKNHSKPSTPIELAKIFRYFIIAAISLYVILAVYSKELLWILTTPLYYNAWTVIPILGLSILLNNVYIFAPGLAIAKKTKVIAGINIAAALLNAILNILLIPLLGIIGAAIATCLSALFAFSIYMRFSQKLYSVPHDWIRISAAVVMSVFAVIICLLISISVTSFSIQNAILRFSIIILTVLIIAFTLLWREDLELLIKKIGWKMA